VSVKLIDYYFSPSSPWTYLGHVRLTQTAERHGATINVKPEDYAAIFPQSGGLPLGKRAPQRQAHRLSELRRWKAHLGVELNLEPKYFPVDATRILERAAQAKDTYQAYTREALARGVFGAPTDVSRDELFWGQDRLDFLDRALAM